MRAAICLLALAAVAAGDDRANALEAAAPLAAALSEGDADAFLARISKDAPERAQLADNVRALVGAAEATSSVEVLQASAGEAEFDWYMQIRSRATGTVIERRRAAVRMRFEGRRILSITPVSYFAPPKI